jgi:uncharacterized RDD family membrane protein YckC
VTSPLQNPYASPTVLSEPLAGPPPPETQQLATRGQRFAGALIDGLIAMLLVVPLAFGAGVVYVIMQPGEGFDTDSVPFKIGTGVLGFLIGGGIFLALHGYLLATRGQTIGKYLLKIQIVSDEGQLVPFYKLILARYVPVWIISQFPLIGPLFAIANALAIFRDQRKCFHDDIAGTKVIQLS